ncbi:Type-1 restriction enzyme R protein [Bacteroidales bacterium Barb6]|nr:Type-1 restriction enzyme R protein [Bacteroidales bacterium Barb6]
MTTTNTKESGFESLIVNYLVEENGYEQGANEDYSREYAIDEKRLFRFLNDTQAKELAKLGVNDSNIKRTQFLNRLQSEIVKRGIIDVLRRGLKIYPADLIMFYQTPSEKNKTAHEMFDKNIFSVTRQLMYSRDNTKLALDLCIFINGLPIITCELKNQLTKQDVKDAVYQYKNDRDPKELLFQFKRCMVHFAVDDARVKFCTRLAGKSSWFLPFDKGYNDGAGNPPNPTGIMTDYLWKETFSKTALANIIENYAQVVEETDPDTKKKTEKQIFPRYHQLVVVKNLLADVKNKGVGFRYLIQHSAGSGKSNSIAWLSHQLVGLEKDGKNVVDSVIVVTDRVNLDKQIDGAIRQFMQMSNTVDHAEHSGDLKKAISDGKKIIITTVHKFQFILDDIGGGHKNNKFAIIIDEAHSSQSGRMSAAMNTALGGEYDPDEDTEDKIVKLMEGRKMLTNASYFAFTATPKNKTLEMFGVPETLPDGTVTHCPFHNYSMKQAIQEEFIRDVLKYYTPIKSYYKLAKTIIDDPRFDKKKAQKKLRAFVESDSFAISTKANIMVEHFHGQVKSKIGGKARAMVVTGSIERAIEYYYAINQCLEAIKSPFKAIIAFSGDKEYGGKVLNESLINGFPSHTIEKTFKQEPYRFLVVADKFQTGYDEPLLHTMYVDKMLTDIKAVQTLSRLNRAHPQKSDTFVLDFANESEDIQQAFERYYRTTLLSGETNPNKLYDLIAVMENYQIYTVEQINNLVELFLSGAERDTLDPILDVCVVLYKKLDEDGQVAFKSSAKGFVRTYGFLGAILPYGNAEWEKLSIFLNLLLPKLPSPVEEDFSKGILETIDLDSYRAEAKVMLSIQLEDADAEIEPMPVGSGKGKPEPELDLLTHILSSFNELFGNIDWKDADNVRRQIAEIPAMVAKDEKYQNAMRNSDKQNARLESDNVLQQVIFSIMSDNMELFKQFNDNPSFKKWLADMVFNATYNKEGKGAA